MSKDERRKPAPIVYYDHMKGGVDIVDLLSTMLSTRSKNRCWPLNANFFTCDMVRTNARTIYNECNNVNLSNFESSWCLGKELVRPLAQQRFDDPVGLQPSVLGKIKRVLGLNANIAPVPTDSAWIPQCLKDINGPDYKEKKKKLNNKLVDKCMICKKHLCRKQGHCYCVCASCHKD